MRRGRRKDLYRSERDSLEGPQEEAEIQRKAYRRGKNLASSEDTCLEKERVRSKVTPTKVGVGWKRRREPSKRKLGWRLAWWGSTEKKEVSHLLGLRGRHQYSDQRSNRNKASCVASIAVRIEGEVDQMARSSAYREQLTEEGRKAGRSLMKREKKTGPERILVKHLDGLERKCFVILINHASAPIRKKRSSPTSKARREASRNEFMEKGRMPDRVESFREVNSRADHPRARPGFVKPIRNGLRKEQNLI